LPLIGLAPVGLHRSFELAARRAIERDAKVLWAHSGFDRPEKCGEMLGKCKNLWADLAFRTDGHRAMSSRRGGALHH
jgi:hypothetical protein